MPCPRRDGLLRVEAEVQGPPGKPLRSGCRPMTREPGKRQLARMEQASGV